MAKKYLDDTGLAYFWGKIKAYVDSHSGGGSGVLDFYPVGSYYETSDTRFDPNTSWGGSWSLEKAGQVHVSAGTGYTVAGALTNTSDGGASSVTLTAAQSGVPAHSHTATGTQYYVCCDTATANNANVALYSSGTRRRVDALDTTANVWHHNRSTANNTAANATAAHNNMQPYIIVNRWHRTA